MLKPECPGQFDDPRQLCLFTVKSHCPDQGWYTVDVQYTAEWVNECQPWAR